MQRSPLHRLLDIRQAIMDILEFMDGLDQAAFLATPDNDRKTFKAVSASFQEIGEAVKALPPEVTEKHKKIPWRAISGMRDHIAHEYFKVDVQLIWSTIENGELDMLLDIVQAEIKIFRGE